jgi:hypothetical protein
VPTFAENPFVQIFIREKATTANGKKLSVLKTYKKPVLYKYNLLKDAVTEILQNRRASHRDIFFYSPTKEFAKRYYSLREFFPQMDSLGRNRPVRLSRAPVLSKKASKKKAKVSRFSQTRSRLAEALARNRATAAASVSRYSNAVANRRIQSIQKVLETANI